MQEFRCKTCEAVIDLSAAHDGVVECKFCHNVYTVPTSKGDVEQQLRIAENELDACDFDRAFTAYAKAAAIDEKEPEAHFGLALASFKIQYIRDTKDPNHKRLQPICREVTDKQFSESKHYLKALSLATGEQKKVYQRRAEEIDAIGKEFYRLKKSGLRYDCFICVKVSDDKGGNTQDSHEALKLYNYLKKQGYSPFYSEEEMQGRVGVDYAALILYALYTSECMLVVCGDEDYLLTPWVRNEYTQFGELMEGGRKDADAIAIVFKGKPIQNLPGRRAKLQGVNLSSATAYVEITNYVDKHTPEARARKLREAELKERERKAKEQQADAQARLIEEMKAQLEALKSEQSKKKEEPKPVKDSSDELAALKAEFEAKLKELSKPATAPEPKATTTVKFADSLSGDELLAALEKAQKDKAEREQAERKKRQAEAERAFREAEKKRKEEEKRAAEEKQRAEEEFKKTYLQVGETVTIGKLGKYNIEWEVRKLSGDTAVLVSKHALSIQSGDTCPIQYDSKTKRRYVDTKKRHSYINNWIDGELIKALTEDERAFFHGSAPFRLLSKRDAEELFPSQAGRKKRAFDTPAYSGSVWWLNDWLPPDNPENRYACNVPRQNCVSLSGYLESETVVPEKKFGVVLKAVISSKRSDYHDLYDAVKIKERKAARIAAEKVQAEEAERIRIEELERIEQEKQRIASEEAERKAEKERAEKNERLRQQSLEKTMLEMRKKEKAEARERYEEKDLSAGDFEIRKMQVATIFESEMQIVLEKYKGTGANVVIPDSVTCISENAFNGAQNTVSLTLPSSLKLFCKESGTNPLMYCRNLESITVASGNPTFVAAGNCLLERHKNSAHLVAGCKTSVIPSDMNILSIGSGAFFCCSSLTKIAVPEGVCDIHDSAFRKCGLKEISLPDSLAFIGDYAFYGCEALESIVIPRSVSFLGKCVFQGCLALKTVTMPKTLKKYIKTAFNNKGKGIKFTFTK